MESRERIGLLFGSFDPIHLGHLAIARWAVASGGFNSVWIVLSPQNPLKPTLAAPYEYRKAMVELSLEGESGIELCTIESELEAPFYTINTIERLRELHPNSDFAILCGTDVKKQSSKWHRAEELHSLVEFVEYPRYDGAELPFIDISSTELRQGYKLEYLKPSVKDYIEQNSVYNMYLERGNALYRKGDICAAINEWNQCKGEPHQSRAEALKQLADDILAYRYTDILNP